MRFGFVCDVIATTRRPGCTVLRPVTMLLRPPPAMALAPPSTTGPQLYAGVVELSTAQHADVHGAAVLANARLVTVTLVDPEDSTLLPMGDRERIAEFLLEAGLSGTLTVEGRAAILDRICRRLCPGRGLRHCWNRLATRDLGPRPPRRDRAMRERLRRLGRA